ncbi:MAG: L,D-transpeptidase family protein [Thermodesulfovibrionales bacterium]|nr:L,D-transpeptidase family protein [Thermodesulfovibrionales bacterium]
MKKILTSLTLVFVFIIFSPHIAITSTINIDNIVVLKSHRIMLMMKEGDIVKSYRISLGKEPKGHKTSEGDKKTPEGLYFIEYKKADSKFYKALKISYPNEQDRLKASSLGLSPGGLIMIHGLPKDKETLGRFHRRIDWTDGCIAVTNEEIDEIWEMVSVGTPVFISP